MTRKRAWIEALSDASDSQRILILRSYESERSRNIDRSFLIFPFFSRERLYSTCKNNESFERMEEILKKILT